VRLEHIPRWAIELKAEATQILSTVESSRSRRLTLDASYERLGQLSLKQDDLFRQALRCVEHELYRAAHVMAWAAFADYLHEVLVTWRSKELQEQRPKWKIRYAEDLRSYSDFQIIEATAVTRLVSKTAMKGLHGLLNKRNECAHPEDYFPGLNDTLGYLDEIFKRIESIQTKL
jgi:hypothetical protein